MKQQRALTIALINENDSIAEKLLESGSKIVSLDKRIAYEVLLYQYYYNF